MPSQITTGTIHHLGLTVVDVARSAEFYSEVLGMQQVAEFGSKLLLHNGTVLLALGPAPEQPIANDRFDENRVGLDHVSFSVGSRDELERALEVLQSRGVPHGEIKALEPFQIYVLAFRDPDNIQVELTAPYG